MNNLPKARTSDIVVQETDKEVLIYDLQTNKVFALNETAGFVWKQCNGNNLAAEIAEMVKQEFNSPVDEDFIWLALDGLQKENLLESKPKLPNLKRRALIKKVGLTSIIALPLITSFFAPTAAKAQSIGSAACTINAPGCQPTNNTDLFVFEFMGSPTPFCQVGDSTCQGICDAAITQCCSCNTDLIFDNINAAFVCRCV